MGKIIQRGWISSYLNLELKIFLRLISQYTKSSYNWYFVDRRVSLRVAYILRNSGLCYTNKEKVVLNNWYVSQNEEVPVHMVPYSY